jgi:hypothetical protein
MPIRSLGLRGQLEVMKWAVVFILDGYKTRFERPLNNAPPSTACAARRRSGSSGRSRRCGSRRRINGGSPGSPAASSSSTPRMSPGGCASTSSPSASSGWPCSWPMERNHHALANVRVWGSSVTRLGGNGVGAPLRGALHGAELKIVLDDQ